MQLPNKLAAFKKAANRLRLANKMFKIQIIKNDNENHKTSDPANIIRFLGPLTPL